MPTAQTQLIEAVYEKRAPLLGAINRAAPWHVLHRKRTMELLHPDWAREKTVLDLACGTGILAAAYAEKVGHVTLVDLLPSMIELAKASLEQAGFARSTEFYACPVNNLPPTVLDQQYDIILMTQALNFFEDTSGVFEVASKCLSAEGLLHVDIDNPLRWIIIEALSGNIQNALTIAHSSQDVSRNIVGTDYWFHRQDVLVRQAEAHGLQLRSVRGICSVSSLLHIFNQSSDFLEPSTLDPRARSYLDKSSLAALGTLDATLENTMPVDIGGWTVLQFKRK